MDVNPTKEKKLTNIRTHAHDEALRLTPPRPLTLESAIEFIAGDELVEVTPAVDPAAQAPARQARARARARPRVRPGTRREREATTPADATARADGSRRARVRATRPRARRPLPRAPPWSRPLPWCRHLARPPAAAPMSAISLSPHRRRGSDAPVDGDATPATAPTACSSSSRRGMIRIVNRRGHRPSSFLDIRSRVRTAASAACSAWPSTRASRRTGTFFVYYTRSGGDIVVARYTANAARTAAAGVDRAVAPAHRAQPVRQPQRRHARLRARRLPLRRRSATAAAAAIRRATPRTSTRCSARSCASTSTDRRRAVRPLRDPVDNPFVGERRRATRSGRTACATRGASRSTARPASCGSPTSARARCEEIDREPAGAPAGRNYGWNVMEGKHCYDATSCPLGAADTLPVAEYTTTAATARSPAATCTAARATRSSSATTSSPTTARGRIWTLPPTGGARRPCVRRDTPADHLVRRDRGRRAVRS